MAFTHEKLEVYQSAIRFLALVHESAKRDRVSRSNLFDQLRRAALSIVLNIAEGAGEFSPAEKRRFYRFALRSGNECAAAIHAAQVLAAIDDAARVALLTELQRTVAMLTKLAMKPVSPSTKP